MDETPETTEPLENNEGLLTLTSSDYADKIVLAAVGAITCVVVTRIATKLIDKIEKSRKDEKNDPKNP